MFAATKASKNKSEVGFLLCHQIKKRLDQIPVFVFREADFFGEDFEMSCFENCRKFFQFSFGEFDCFFLILIDLRKERFCEAGEVPLGDARLILISIATLSINGAEFLGGIKAIHEGAGAVVDGLAGKAHVVGVHDAVDESDTHPLSDELGLANDDIAEEISGVFCVGVVTLVCVINQGPETFKVSPGCEKLGCANPEVGAGDTGEDPAFFGFFTED